jgi:hypothetical protein
MGLKSYSGAIITKDGKQRLAAEIHELEEKLRKSRQDNGDRNARRCGETGNGMPARDEVTRQHDTIRYRLEDRTRFYEQATVAEEPFQRDTLEIGCIARLRRRSNGRWLYIHVHVVGLGETECDSTPRKLSYDAPLIAPFYAQRQGYEEEVTIGKVTRTYRLVGIYLPFDKEVRGLRDS